LLVTRGHAVAAAEICPAEVNDSHAFTPDADGVLYSIVLDAATARTARGTIVVDTNAGYFTFGFSDMPFIEDVGRYRASIVFERDRYVTTLLYVRFPAAVTAVKTWWVTKAQTTGEKTFGWYAHGMVTCSLAPPDETTLLNWPSNDKHLERRVSPLPYDLTALPLLSQAIVIAAASPAPGSTNCATPFSSATANKAVSPDYPVEARSIASSRETALVKVIVDSDGSVAEASTFVPSGNAAIDAAAVKAALQSTYTPAVSFCQPVPGVYLFQAEFNAD